MFAQAYGRVIRVQPLMYMYTLHSDWTRESVFTKFIISASLVTVHVEW